jgi:hypothetical protein
LILGEKSGEKVYTFSTFFQCKAGEI